VGDFFPNENLKFSARPDSRVYKDGEIPRFYPLRVPEKTDVVAVAERVAVRVAAGVRPVNWRVFLTD